MSFTLDELNHVLTLAHSSIPTEDKNALLDQLQPIFKHMQDLNALDLDGLMPISHPFETGLFLREDVLSNGESIDLETLSDHVEGHSFVVPRIIGDA